MRVFRKAALLCLFPSICIAQTERELDAHDHGAGSLNVAIEEATIYIEFGAPWDNLVGFEHAPANAEQSQLVDSALETLRSPESLFAFNGADCSVEDVSVEHSMEHEGDDHESEDHHDDHKEDEHHDDHAEDEHHDDHAEDEHHDDHAEDEHSDHSSVFATYVFNCDNTASLDSIDVSIFSVWAQFEELDVQMIGPTGASSVELVAGSSRLNLSQVN